jgi:hypothetical protein
VITLIFSGNRHEYDIQFTHKAGKCGDTSSSAIGCRLQCHRSRLQLYRSGNDRILLPEKSLLLKEKAPALGIKIYDPDVSMITSGGGGVHCMCQALRRDPG